MNSACLPVTREIRELFTQEIKDLGGSVCDAYDDGDHLFLRAVLARQAKVAPRDGLNAGVALRTLGDEVLVHPYTFRQICRNGAIIAHAIETRSVVRVGFAASCEAIEAVVTELGEAIRASASPEAFARATREMRSGREVEADTALHLMPHLSRLPGHLAARLYSEIVDEFEDHGDRSVFGLMNAVTAVARETRDPETRWRLEELGGGIPANLSPRRPTPAPGRAKLVRV